MAHRPIGSTQTDRIRLPYTARRAFFFKVQNEPNEKGVHSAPILELTQVKIQNGNDQFGFQPAA